MNYISTLALAALDKTSGWWNRQSERKRSVICAAVLLILLAIAGKSRAPRRAACTTRRVMSFFGWTAEQRGGVWYARKLMDGGNYGSTGAVWVRKAITGLGRNATKRDAERGIMRMYRAGVLN